MTKVTENENYPIIKTLTEHLPPPIVDEVSATLSYIGFSAIGTREDVADWKIMKVEKVGTITKSTFPNSSMKYEFKWSDRATYTYTR